MTLNDSEDSSKKSSICESEIQSLKSNEDDISVEKSIGDEDSIEYISLDVSIVSLKSKTSSIQSTIDVNVKELADAETTIQEKIEVGPKATVSRVSHYIYISLFIFVATGLFNI